MPPPMPNPSNRMTANPLRPVRRYRPGKAVVEEPSSDEEEEEDEEQEQQQRAASRKVPIKPKPQTKHESARTDPAEPGDDDEEGFVTEDEDEDVARPPTYFAAKDGSAKVGAGLSGDRGVGLGDGSENEEDEEGDEEDEEDEEDESSEEEESSSEDEPQRKFLRPTFIKRTDRKTSSGAAAAAAGATSLISAASNGIVRDEAGEQEEARRREMADLMIKDKLERDAAARAAGKKSWDDDDEVVGEDVVDDTDDVDPEAELAAWKLRELKRLKRDREAIEAHEREIEERERRSKLTQAERDAEDAERLARQKEEREEGRGKAGFMQRYHHKGAFFQDDETAEMLRKRDLMGARYVDEVKNREALPEYMQIRNMEKLGKKGRTRYKDLKGEDTGRWGDYAKQDARFLDRNSGPDLRNVDERFQPDREGGGRAGPTGANASAVRDRRKRSPSPYRDREGEKRPRLEAT
jgi:microfibrillar-associated protein 1